MRLRPAIACLAAVATANAAAAAEVCSELSGQYANTRTCVSSVLPSQGGNSYGPDRVSGSDETGAWCEGVPGPGVGQTITVFQKPPEKVGTMMVVNGYAKSADTFQANGRVKRARIETNLSYSRVVTLKDKKEMQEIKFPPGKPAWLKLTILEVYPGARHDDTCLCRFYFNHEQFGG
jgi:hypothetical protein